MTIIEYLRSLGMDCEHTLPEVALDAIFEFGEWPIDSHCGQECVKIVDAAAPLLAIADSEAHTAIWYAVIRAMSIICVG